jgi:predicted metal-dependent phosphoesterase TrpH
VVSRIDLHIHSTASDGKFSPEDIVHRAIKLGLTVIALCDHDSVNGVIPALEAARAFPQISVIPGVEVSTYTPGSEVHLLGYFVDYTDPEFKAALVSLRSSRRARADKMIAKLKSLNVHIDWEQVQEIAGSGSIGRPHIAQVMLEKGYITSIKEAFTKYIGFEGPAYIERQKITSVEAAALVIKAGGLPVLAHPLTASNPEAIIAELKTAGLVGLEINYNGYTKDERDSLAQLAKKYDLIATGGSDYHGLDDSAETMIGGTYVPEESVEQLIARAQSRVLKPAS